MSITYAPGQSPDDVRAKLLAVAARIRGMRPVLAPAAESLSMLLGLGFGQWVLNRKMFVRAMPPPARLLQTAGRHSLIIYLLHQPLLFAMVWLAALAIQPQADANIPQGNYIRACITRCEQTGSDPGFCARACNCIAQETLRTDIWKHVVRNNLTPVLQKQYDGIIAACRR